MFHSAHHLYSAILLSVICQSSCHTTLPPLCPAVSKQINNTTVVPIMPQHSVTRCVHVGIWCICYISQFLQS